MKKNEKIIVAMSGGVDSSVTALLLKRKGFDVSGAFMKLGTAKDVESEKKAKRVARFLKIPFYVFDFRKEFKKRIINTFLNDYKKGLTPNPCVLCNKELKFGLLLEKSLKKIRGEKLATGHYARIEEKKGKFYLLRAKDKEKDQSYFLWMLNQHQLKRIIFPLGSYGRQEVEILAKKFKLPLENVKKSLEICFVPDSINDFLKRYLKEKPGRIIDFQGRILGEHQGIWFYTIGQRKKLFLQNGPFFVEKKDIKKNFLIVTKKREKLLKKEIVAKNVNWVTVPPKNFPLKVKAKIRYRAQLSSATLYPLSCQSYLLKFKKHQEAVTPGQSVVFYKKENLLGGGFIS